MITAIFALPIVALAAWLGYRAGQRRMARDAHIVMQLVADGRAEIADDGTVQMVDDPPFVEVQREVAVWQ